MKSETLTDMRVVEERGETTVRGNKGKENKEREGK